MSRTSVILENECKKFFKWVTQEDSEGKITGATFVYWDKENQKNVEAKLPFTFALLDDSCMTIKGYNEKTGQGVYSNEVNHPDHELVIKSNKETLLKFKRSDYKANKDKIEGFGGKYHQSVYGAMLNEKGEYELINLQIKGAALTGACPEDERDWEEDDKNAGWMNFKKFFKTKLYSNMITIKDYKLRKKGKTRFTTPLFEVGSEISKEQSKIFDNMDIALKGWFKYYFNLGKVDNVATGTPVNAYAEELPFDKD